MAIPGIPSLQLGQDRNDRTLPSSRHPLFNSTQLSPVSLTPSTACPLWPCSSNDTGLYVNLMPFSHQI